MRGGGGITDSLREQAVSNKDGKGIRVTRREWRRGEEIGEDERERSPSVD